MKTWHKMTLFGSAVFVALIAQAHIAEEPWPISLSTQGAFWMLLPFSLGVVFGLFAGQIVHEFIDLTRPKGTR